MAERLSTGFVNALNVTGSVKDIMANGVIHIYSGTQPTDADSAELGDHLLTITKGSLAFIAGVATNGLNLASTSSNGVVLKDSNVWSGIGLMAGTAGWFRWYANDVTTGASTTAIRIDGAIGVTSSYEMQMTNTTIVLDGPTTISTFSYTSAKS